MALARAALQCPRRGPSVPSVAPLPSSQVPAPTLHPGNTPWRERIAGVVAGVEEAAEGIRRGTRKRMKPLEYFRGERVVYGRRESGRFPCPVEVPAPASTPHPKPCTPHSTPHTNPLTQPAHSTSTSQLRLQPKHAAHVSTCLQVITLPDEPTPPHFRRMRAMTAARDKERAAKGGGDKEAEEPA